MLENQPKYCFINPELGQLIITLTADDDFVCGGHFIIYDSEDKQIIEEWKMTCDFGKPTIYKVLTKINHLHKLKLSYNVLTCTKNANKYEGRMAIKFLQKGKPAKMSHSTSFLMYNVPPCALKSAEDLKGSLFFIDKGELQTNENDNKNVLEEQNNPEF